jgi:hypothetical protein
MRWRVEVKDTAANIRLLRDVFGALSFSLIEEGNERYLISEKFEGLNTANDVYALAVRISAIIEEVCKNNAELVELRHKIGDVLELDRRGPRKYAFAALSATAHATVTLDAVVLRGKAVAGMSDEEKKQLEKEQREREYEKLRRKAVSFVVSALRDDRAAQVQRLLKGNLTPQTMGHIADLIQEDMGEEIKSLVPGQQLTRFYRSINHPAVYGEQARHIVSHVDAPRSPMGLPEAQQFVRLLATRWMERKSEFSGNA